MDALAQLETFYSVTAVMDDGSGVQMAMSQAMVAGFLRGVADGLDDGCAGMLERLLVELADGDG
ncbi:MAG: hypothetical protein WB709_03765 [Solirubrobacteraceae bacterium]